LAWWQRWSVIASPWGSLYLEINVCLGIIFDNRVFLDKIFAIYAKMESG